MFLVLTAPIEIQLGERWTHLVVRELGAGSETFNDIRKGLPLLSPTLLSTRLKTLEGSGIVNRKEHNGNVRYTLTESGNELTKIIWELGTWAHRWVRSDLSKDDLDPSVLTEVLRGGSEKVKEAGAVIAKSLSPSTKAWSRALV